MSQLTAAAVAALGLCACLAPVAPDAEAVVDESDLPGESGSKAGGGERLDLPEIRDAIAYTRVWTIGNPANLTRVYVLVHGDGNTDYSDSTAADRRDMGERLPEGEGALVAYPVSPSSHWPAFEQGRNGRVLLRLFAELARRATGAQPLLYEQFALSGGGRVNHALLRLIDEGYGRDPEVTRFADQSLRGIHDGDSLCYSIDAMRERYVRAIDLLPHARFAFIHNTSGQMAYVHRHHELIAKRFDGGVGYPFGGSLSLQDGRLRFWSAPTHWTAWKGQFARVFFGTDAGSPPAPRPGDRWIGEACGVGSDCASGLCLGESDGFPGGMCSQACERSCPDRIGLPTTYCIAAGSGEARCYSHVDHSARPGTGCRPGYHGESRPRAGTDSRRDVCVPDADLGSGAVTIAGEGTPLDIPDATPGGARSSLRVAGIGRCTLDARVELSIRHPYRGDLVVGLTDPSGARVVLADRTGAAAADLRLDLATPSLGGTGADGTWTLDVADVAARDTGTLEWWRLVLACR